MIKQFFYRLSDRWYYDAKEDLLYAFFAFINTKLGYTFLTHKKLNIDFKLVSDLIGIVITPLFIGKVLVLSGVVFGVLIFIKPTRSIRYILSAIVAFVSFVFYFLYGVITEIILTGFMESSILLTISFIGLTLCGMEVVRVCQMKIQKKV